MNCNIDYEKIKKKIEEDRKCMPKYVCCVGPQGPAGPEGPQGPEGPAGECSCLCEAMGQMIENGEWKMFLMNNQQIGYLQIPKGFHRLIFKEECIQEIML